MADPSNSIKQPAETKEEELDAALDADINPEPPTQPDSKTLDGANDPHSTDDIDGVPEVAEPRILAKKDATLREFLNKMDDQAPIVSTPNLLVFVRPDDISADMNIMLDTRRSDKLLHDACWLAASTPNLPTPQPSPRSCNAEVRC